MDTGVSERAKKTESIFGHLKKVDHWTFLLALGPVIANIAVGLAYLSAAAAALLLVALGYDIWEFYASE